jgi:dolichol-phosphate mannosyltransferase
MKYAIDNGYDYLVTMDADNSHHPRYLQAIVGGMEHADVSIGSRYTSGGSVKNWPLKRRLMSKGVNLYARMLLGLPTRDNSGAFRCFRVETLKQLDFDSIRSRGYSFFEEVLWLLKRKGARFSETPIEFVDREFGQSKINSREAARSIWIITRLGIKNWLGL